MKTRMHLSLSLVVSMFALSASVAAPVSGFVRNRLGNRLGDIQMTATQISNPSNVLHVTAGRSGDYTLELETGDWLLELDSDQLAEWGYQTFSLPLVISSPEAVQLDLVPEPIEPPIPPVLTLTTVTEERFTLLIVGGGGRTVRVERSPDLRVWTYMTSLTTAKGRISYGSNFSWGNPTSCFWRVIVTE